MDFSDRKCCEDGSGNKKSSGFYLKMCVELILNVSVFSDENWRPARNMLPIESVGFTCIY